MIDHYPTVSCRRNKSSVFEIGVGVDELFELHSLKLPSSSVTILKTMINSREKSTPSEVFVPPEIYKHG